VPAINKASHNEAGWSTQRPEIVLKPEMIAVLQEFHQSLIDQR